MIQNEKLIKELIKLDYDISLSSLENIDFVFTKVGIKTVEDYEELLQYLGWYTIKSQEQGHKEWTLDFSKAMYVKYIDCVKDVPDFERFPKKDMYAIVEKMEKIVEENERNLASQAYILAKDAETYNW